MPEYSRSNHAARNGDAFAAWERETGRGWSVFEYETELEPTFSRFVFNRTTPPLIDDGRVQSRIGRFFSSLNTVPQRPDLPLDKLVPADPVPGPIATRKILSIRAHLPNDSKELNIAIEQLLLSLARSASVVSFEIIGTAAEVALQISCPATECNAVISHLQSHVPQIDFRVAGDEVANNFGSSDAQKMVAVDFGLGKEWFTPLPFGGDFGIDPMTPLFSILESLRNDEVICLQVLFSRTRHEWQRSVQEVIFDRTGKPIFANLHNRLPAMKEKLSSPLLAACIRLLVSSNSRERSVQLARQTGVYLKQFSAGNQNELFPLASDLPGIEKHVASVLRRTTYRSGMLLTPRELSGIVRWPSDGIRSEKLKRDQNRTKAAPASATKGTIVLGENIHAGSKQIIRVSPASHSLLIGGTGTGKSTLLLSEIVQNVADHGSGLCLVDPHGDLVDEVMARIPDHRIRDVVLFDPADEKFPIGFNILQANSETEKIFLASDLVATFKSYSTSWGDVMDSVLANAVLAFVESTRGGTLFDLKRFLVEKEFRREFLETVPDEAIRYFWTNEFPVIAGRTQSSVLIRLDSFLRQKLIRNIVCQTGSGLDLRRVLDERKILLVKLAQGLIGEQNAAFLGTLLISKLYQIALTRQDIDPSKRSLFPCFIDEAAHFVGNPSMSLILANLRKFGIALTLATQTYRQIRDRGEKDVAEAVLANCQTRICFRLGDNDAEKLASGFSFFDAKALQNLGVGEAIVRIERAECDFNLKTYPAEPVEKDMADRRKAAIIEHTRQTYATPVGRVEDLLRITRELRPATRRGERSGVREGKASFSQEDVPSSIVPSETTAAGNAADPGKGGKHHQAAKSVAEPGAASASTPPIIPTPQDRMREPSITTTRLRKAHPEIQTEETTSEHQYLQRLIKRIAEKYDFIATVEKEVLGGAGRVDVALENGAVKVACEVAVTNTVDYEVQSIQKCISAGYDEVIVLSINETHLREIERAAKTTISPGHFENVTFLKPDNFHLYLERLSAQAPEQSSDVKIKGYKILTSFADTTPSEAELIKETIVEILETEDRR